MTYRNSVEWRQSAEYAEAYAQGLAEARRDAIDARKAVAGPIIYYALKWAPWVLVGATVVLAVAGH